MFDKSTWFITGASAGFGRALAQAVLARGGRVVATARDVTSLDVIAEAGGARALLLPLDVALPDQIAAAISQAEAFGGVDVLVNNAGYGFLGGIEESGENELRRQLEVNFFGAAALIRHCLPAMRARGLGFIVNISSIAGARGFAGSGWYAASKFALEGLSEALAAEVKPFGIGVMIVEPGAFRTDFAGRSIVMPTAPIPAYEELAANRLMVSQHDGLQAGDPTRAAEAILNAVESPEPPMRLVLGKAAVGLVRTALEARLADLNSWMTVAEGADFPE
jgi:NAD(P)-dependent dehydrogenase (short-subunit alcohol dehydrogenase family)